MVGVAIVGASRTAFGKLPGRTTIDLQVEAATAALVDADVCSTEVDAVLCGYSTVSNHLMPGNLLAERLGIRPTTALGLNVGGATGLAMLVQGCALVQSGAADVVLVAAGENRATGQTRTQSSEVLAQVAERTYEVPLGGTVPSYYALLSSIYHHRHSLPEGALAGLSVQMRRHATSTPGAHFTRPIDREDVLGSPVIAEPLRLLECCPVSDGGAAVVLCRDDLAMARGGVTVQGTGSANRHQHISEITFDDTGAGRSCRAAFEMAGRDLTEVEVLGVYDSFTITLALILEETGLVTPGTTGQAADRGAFGADGNLPLNLHGGLLSYGHSGVAGGLAHLVEVVDQLRGRSGDRQLDKAGLGYVHGDGGVMSAHVSAVLASTE